MAYIITLSNMVIPVVFVLIITVGLIKHINVYEVFVKGAKDGLFTVANILPTLVGLMIGIGVLRNSGFLDFVTTLVSPLANLIHFPPVLVPLSLIKVFSSSAATGLILDIYKEFGPDSFIGLCAGIMMSCTETVFYTMSVYFLAAKVTKTRWTLKGGLLCSAVGIAASILLTRLIMLN